jgi:hypothetical protein
VGVSVCVGLGEAVGVMVVVGVTVGVSVGSGVLVSVGVSVAMKDNLNEGAFGPTSQYMTSAAPNNRKTAAMPNTRGARRADCWRLR